MATATVEGRTGMCDRNHGGPVAHRPMSLFDGYADLSELRAQGTRTTAHAQVMTQCSRGCRGGSSCGTAAMWLAFTAGNQQMLVNEKPVDGTLYVPHGQTDSLEGVVTTVAYDPSNPYNAQP